MTKKIILILIVILIISAAGFYFWQKRDVYFFKGEIETKEDSNDLDSEILDDEDDEGGSDDSEDGDEESLDENGENDIISVEEFEDDCRTECRNILDEEENDYCREICGFKEDENRELGDCEVMEGFNKNVCFKNKAIQELDDNYCEKIEDDNVLKENCRNRVLEELIEKEQGGILEE